MESFWHCDSTFELQTCEKGLRISFYHSCEIQIKIKRGKMWIGEGKEKGIYLKREK